MMTVTLDEHIARGLLKLVNRAPISHWTELFHQARFREALETALANAEAPREPSSPSRSAPAL